MCGLSDARAATRSRSDVVMVGQVRPEKGILLAVEAASQAGIALTLIGPRPRRYEAWFEQRIRPVLEGAGGTWLGEQSWDLCQQIIAASAALLYLPSINEPFGLAILEALCSGTPVIANDNCASREMIVPGRTGFICTTLESVVTALADVSQLDQGRPHAECRRFTPARVAQEHLEIYEWIIRGSEANQWTSFQRR